MKENGKIGSIENRFAGPLALTVVSSLIKKGY